MVSDSDKDILTYYFSKIKIVWVIYVFLHLGGDEIVHVKDIVVMMDMEKTTISAITRNFSGREKKVL